MTIVTSSSNIALAFQKLEHVLFGVFIWDFFMSLKFDWEFITRKRQFRWPMLFYFLGRYLLFVSQVGIVIGINVPKPDCRALYVFGKIAGVCGIGLSSINLAIRTMAVWENDIRVVAGLMILILGHWGVIFRALAVNASWIVEAGIGCATTWEPVNTGVYVVAIAAIAMVLDFVVLALLWLKLYNRQAELSSLARLLLTDGTVFVIVALAVNVSTVVFGIFSLNDVSLHTTWVIAAGIISTMVASHAVRRLSNHVVLGQALPVAHQNGQRILPPPEEPVSLSTQLSDGIHIHIDTHVTHDDPDAQAHKDGVSSSSISVYSDTSNEKPSHI